MKLNRDFFKNGEVIFVGYSGRNPLFSKSVYKAFTDAGLKVFPVNRKREGKYDVKVYNDLGELPHIPESAYVLLGAGNVKEAVSQLKAGGVKRILFQNGKAAKEVLEDCSAAGIEAAVGCPMMIYGGGLHKFHALLAGVK